MIRNSKIPLTHRPNAAGDLPVVPKCRRPFACVVGQINSTNLAIPRSQEGRIAIVTDVGRGMRWPRMAHKTNVPVAYDEAAWS